MMEYTEAEHIAIYQAMSEHEHQRELFAWAGQVGQVGLAAATIWVLDYPMTDKHRSIEIIKRERGNGLGDSRLRWLHAIPNSGHGARGKAGVIRGARMKAEGLRKGVPDVFLPLPAGTYAGLYLELKDCKKGKPGKEQLEFAEYVKSVGYAHRFCRGYLEAIEAITWYLNLKQ